MAGGMGSGNSQLTSYIRNNSDPSYFLRWSSTELEKERTRLNDLYAGMGNVVDNPTFQKLFIKKATDQISGEDFSAGLQLSLIGQNQTGASGPTTAQQATNIEHTMNDIARTLGLPPQDWSGFAMQAAQNNWSADVIRDLVADQIQVDSMNNAGIVHDAVSSAKELAANNYVSISDEEAFGWAKQIAHNEMDTTSLKAEIQRRAIAKFSWLKPQIESGVTVKEYFRPHRELIGSLLEKSPDQIDLMNDMKWWPVVGGGKPTETAARQDMSLIDTARYVRSLDDWKKTKNARTEVDNAVVNLGKNLGVM